MDEKRVAGGALFNGELRGRARDWNWHNVIGLWSAPVLIVLIANALPISYRWAGDLIYKITRTTAPGPTQSSPGSAAGSSRLRAGPSLALRPWLRWREKGFRKPGVSQIDSRID